MSPVIKPIAWLIGLTLLLFLDSPSTLAHGVDANTEQFLSVNQGLAIGAYSHPS